MRTHHTRAFAGNSKQQHMKTERLASDQWLCLQGGHQILAQLAMVLHLMSDQCRQAPASTPAHDQKP